MSRLTADQRQKIRDYLAQQGVTFKPLKDEMMDHLSCDLEFRMSEGHSFDKAWLQVKEEIGENHFRTVQYEIMETINKRFMWSQGLSFMALGLLLISGLFKVLHLAFAGELLILSFAFIAASLLTASLTGVLINREKKGAVRVLSMIVGIILLLAGFSFKFLHLPGADGLILLAVGALVITLLVNTIYVYQNSSGRGNLITYLHEKYTPGIERFLLILFFPLLVYKLLLILQNDNVFVGNMLLLVVMFASGLQFIAMSWRIMESDLAKRNALTLIAAVLSSLCLAMPFLGPLVPFDARVVIIVLFTISSGWLAYTMEDKPRFVSGIMTCLVPLIFAGWALIHLEIFPPGMHSIFFNVPVLLTLVTGLLLSRKYGMMRAYMLISVSSYLFEYIL